MNAGETKDTKPLVRLAQLSELDIWLTKVQLRAQKARFLRTTVTNHNSD